MEAMLWFDRRLPWWAHQIVGACFGIIFCSWFTEATPEQVAIIRLPATIIVTTYTAGILWCTLASFRRP